VYTVHEPTDRAHPSAYGLYATYTIPILSERAGEWAAGKNALWRTKSYYIHNIYTYKFVCGVVARTVYMYNIIRLVAACPGESTGRARCTKDLRWRNDKYIYIYIICIVYIDMNVLCVHVYNTAAPNQRRRPISSPAHPWRVYTHTHTDTHTHAS